MLRDLPRTAWSDPDSFVELVSILAKSGTLSSKYHGVIKERIYLLHCIWEQAQQFEGVRQALPSVVKRCIRLYLPIIRIFRKPDLLHCKNEVGEACLRTRWPVWHLKEAFVTFLPDEWLRDRDWVMKYVTQVGDDGMSLSSLVRSGFLRDRRMVADFLHRCTHNSFMRSTLPLEFYGDKELALDVGLKILDDISPSLQGDPDVLLHCACSGVSFFASRVGSRHTSNMDLACIAAEQPRRNAHQPDILQVVSPDLHGNRELQVGSWKIIYGACPCVISILYVV